MAEDAPIRTLELKKPVSQAGKTLTALEFFEPTSSLFDELEANAEWNSNAKRVEDVRASSLVLLANLTRLHPSTIKTLSFRDRKEANDIAADVVGNELDLGEA